MIGLWKCVLLVVVEGANTFREMVTIDPALVYFMSSVKVPAGPVFLLDDREKLVFEYLTNRWQ